MQRKMKQKNLFLHVYIKGTDQKSHDKKADSCKGRTGNVLELTA
jgi:hypothetical protein